MATLLTTATLLTMATLLTRYLTGLATLPDGLLKLDIAAVYLVSTLVRYYRSLVSLPTTLSLPRLHAG